MMKIYYLILCVIFCSVFFGCDKKVKQWDFEYPLIVWYGYDSPIGRDSFLDDQRLSEEENIAAGVIIEVDGNIHDMDSHSMNVCDLHEMLKCLRDGNSFYVRVEKGVTAELIDKWLCEITSHKNIKFIFIDLEH